MGGASLVGPSERGMCHEIASLNGARKPTTSGAGDKHAHNNMSSGVAGPMFN